VETRFSLVQLTDPATRESEKIIRSCVHCGFCTATCPTYLLLGDELDSPRGRIYLIKEMLENDRPATKDVVTHIDRCLSCLACMTTCPSGVHYMHLVDHARAHIEHTYRRPLPDRLARWLLAKSMPFRARFRIALGLGRLAHPFLPLLRIIPGFSRPTAMLALLPKRRAHAPENPLAIRPAPRRGRVAILEGCIQPAIRPEINAAARRLLARLGYEVAEVEGEACCGSLVHHMGRDHEAHRMARHNIDVWTREIETRGLDAIVITASGCGTTIKDYGFIFRDDPAYAENAARISALTRDITEFLEPLELPVPSPVPPLAVAYHGACSLQHGQQITTAPKSLLARAGFEVRDIAEAHICCGSAGTYNILQPELARGLRDRKVAAIEAVRPGAVATGNIGCMAQIETGTGIPVLHTVELLDWAYGGPPPAALAHR
jgi:glycolate oxidase iron-sulfur subunit